MEKKGCYVIKMDFQKILIQVSWHRPVACQFFSFSYNTFKKHISKDREKSGLSGKGLSPIMLVQGPHQSS